MSQTKERHVEIAEHRQTRGVRPRPGGRMDSVGSVRVGGLPTLAPRVEHHRVAGQQLDALGLRRLLDLPPVNGCLPRHERPAAQPRDVDQHAAGDNPVGPDVDRAERCSGERDLSLGVAAVVQLALVPEVTERVQVGHRHPVVVDAEVVPGGPDGGALHRRPGHVVLHGTRIVRPHRLVQRTAQRHCPARFHQTGGRHALLRRDQVHRAGGVILPPPAPIPPVGEVAHDLCFRRRAFLH